MPLVALVYELLWDSAQTQSSHMQGIGLPLVYASLDTFRLSDYNIMELKW